MLRTSGWRCRSPLSLRFDQTKGRKLRIYCCKTMHIDFSSRLQSKTESAWCYRKASTQRSMHRSPLFSMISWRQQSRTTGIESMSEVRKGWWRWWGCWSRKAATTCAVMMIQLDAASRLITIGHLELLKHNSGSWYDCWAEERTSSISCSSGRIFLWLMECRLCKSESHPQLHLSNSGHLSSAEMRNRAWYSTSSHPLASKSGRLMFGHAFRLAREWDKVPSCSGSGQSTLQPVTKTCECMDGRDRQLGNCTFDVYPIPETTIIQQVSSICAPVSRPAVHVRSSLIENLNSNTLLSPVEKIYSIVAAQASTGILITRDSLIGRGRYSRIQTAEII